MTAVVPFDFQGSEVRSGVSDDGQPCVIGKDACTALGISKYRDALSQLDNDERVSILVDTLGGPQRMTAVTESGVYGLLLIAPSDKAQAFRRWLKHEVLPQIRRTGQYVPESPPAPAHELEMGKPVQLTMGHSPVWITPHPDGKWTHATDVCFLFGFRDSDELAAWLPASERRREKVPWGVGGTLNLWVISEAGMRRLLAERQPAPYMNHGATLAHTAMKEWVASGLPALPPPKRHALES